jgi:transcription-repair coupling factor (superfamily II helicase)
MLPAQDLRDLSQTWKVGSVLTNEHIRTHLAQCAYLEVPVVEDPGTFAIRGDIVDVFSPGHRQPIRLERWGDDVSELRSFDPVTQRTVGLVDALHTFPVREEILSDRHIKQAKDAVRQLGSDLHIPSRSVAQVTQELDSRMHFVGIDALLPAFYPELSDVLSHLPSNTIMVLVDPDSVESSADQLEETRRAEHAERTAEHDLCFPFEAHYLNQTELESRLQHFPQIHQHRLLLETSTHSIPDVLEFKVRQNTDIVQLRKRTGNLEETVRQLLPDIDQWRQMYGRICFVCRTRGQVDRLEALLRTLGEDSMVLDPPVDVTEPIPAPAGVIEIYQGDLSDGFRSELLSIALVSGHDLFGNRGVTTASTTTSVMEHAAISHFRDLNAGDLVVHLDFGIGRYQGLTRLEVMGVSNEFLLIEYAGTDKLYIPIYRLGRIQKYIGATEGIRVDKLGGTSWQKTKEKVKANIREIAGDLLKLYAERELRKGFAFSEPDESFREFEDAFPFEETIDQAKAIEEVLSDMCRTRPMDRLVCGDVGFGKTEVAIRAAMKAALDGRQTAVLVPTTILCEQHLISFRRRCEPFGVRVEALSRFRTAKETKEIMEAAKAGKIDILIGTHRLLSKSLEFRDLRLLVVDEEQRFGVTHKEKIKQMRANLDCLTLTATPIPRTLQMSLLGIRDLSVIATPPHDRLPVRTHLAKFNDALIREAILRELNRGGQVFFVHNRVNTIGEMYEHLAKIVPEARITIAHGQMPENELEDVMVSYIQGDTNVLLASSIIESGLDIPNANTILINRADMFGLAQLYQLRGRVGRGKERAYAYLLIPARQKVTDDAEKRLEVIQTYTELGSGFQVATYDLEIRGAGNLLSDDQSGHVAAVGLDLYNELLEEAISEIRGSVQETDVEPEVNIPLEAYLPDTYIPATSIRLMFYKRFSLSRTMDELFETFGEMTDRFGEPPTEVLHLRDVIGIKVRLRAIKSSRLDIGPSSIRLDLLHDTPIQPKKLLDFIQTTRGKLKITSEMKLIYSLTPDESATPLKSCDGLLETLERLT